MYCKDTCLRFLFVHEFVSALKSLHTSSFSVPTVPSLLDPFLNRNYKNFPKDVSTTDSTPVLLFYLGLNPSRKILHFDLVRFRDSIHFYFGTWSSFPSVTLSPNPFLSFNKFRPRTSPSGPDLVIPKTILQLVKGLVQVSTQTRTSCQDFSVKKVYDL